MFEAWLIELVKGIGKLFLNPLFYWIVLLVFLVGYRRIKQEREQFGVKIFNATVESERTWAPAVFIGIVISIAALGTGVIFSLGTLIVLSIVMFLLSIGLRLSFLSAGYTIGLTYIILLFLPRLLENQTWINAALFSDSNFIGLSLLLGILLLAEAYFIATVRRNESFPSLVLSDRGVWIGHHNLKKMTVIPIFFLIPGGVIESFAPYWPLLSFGEDTYGLVLFPFLLGFDFNVRGSLAQLAGKNLSRQMTWLGLLVLALAIGSLFLDVLSFVAVIVAIIGRELIMYRFRIRDKRTYAYFEPQTKGIKVLGVIPETPADRLEIQIGEVIIKVNDRHVNNPEEFYHALRIASASFKLDVLDDANEVRFINSALYEDDDYRLGLIFSSDPYRKKNKTL